METATNAALCARRHNGQYVSITQTLELIHYIGQQGQNTITASLIWLTALQRHSPVYAALHYNQQIK